MSVNVPDQIPVPFADSGLRATIPATTDNVTGRAGFNQGFGAINMTPKTAGGIPPFGQDFNGILFAITEGLRFFQAGSIYTYNSTFSTAVGGYRAGARVLRTDGTGYWLNLTDGNTNDPEAAGALAAGWVPDYTYGAASVTMTNANVTLTPNQYGKPIIVITGTLTANLNLIFPNIYGEWVVFDNTSGAFTITCKTASGTGIGANKGIPTSISCDAFNIYGGIPVASETVAGVIEIANSSELSGGTDNTKAVTSFGIRQALNATDSAPISAARAWVNFNGTGTVAIRKASNVSSITDNGTGDYSLNYTTPMPDILYCPVCMATGVPLDDGGAVSAPKTVSVFRFSTFNLAGTARTDYPNISIAIFD